MVFVYLFIRVKFWKLNFIRFQWSGWLQIWHTYLNLVTIQYQIVTSWLSSQDCPIEGLVTGINLKIGKEI